MVDSAIMAILIIVITVGVVVLSGYVVLTSRKIGPYVIIREIPSGGMSRLFQCIDVRFMKIIVKIPIDRYPSDDIISKFLEEGEILSRLRHRNIVACKGFGITIFHGMRTGYIALEFIEGKTLDTIMERDGHFTLNESMLITASIADALNTCHAEEILHRDISPQNIMVRRINGNIGKEDIKLIDFGTAKWVRGEGKLTTKDMMKVNYASPEQIRRLTAEPLDKRTDIFSLGAVCYELITHSKAFESEARQEMPLAPHVIKDYVTHDISHMIMKMLALIKEERLSDLHDVTEFGYKLTLGNSPNAYISHDSTPHSHFTADNLLSNPKVILIGLLIITVTIMSIIIIIDAKRTKPLEPPVNPQQPINTTATTDRGSKPVNTTTATTVKKPKPPPVDVWRWVDEEVYIKPEYIDEPVYITRHEPIPNDPWFRTQEVKDQVGIKKVIKEGTGIYINQPKQVKDGSNN